MASTNAQIPAQVAAAAAVAAGGQGNQARANLPFFGNPMLGGMNFPGNFYPQMAAFAAAQENATAMIATAKLGNCKSNPDSNSSLVVRSSARKFNVNGGIFSVAQWCRKTVEENLEWLIKVTKRHCPNEKAVLLAYGDGCETLVLLDDHANKMPDDFKKLKKIGVGASLGKVDAIFDEKQLATMGVLAATDSIWEHLRYEAFSKSHEKNIGKPENIMFVHTAVAVWGGSTEGRRRVLQVKTGAPGNPYQPVIYLPNPVFEQQVLARWQQAGSGQQANLEGEKEIWINFNPKELILLEKAFDNRLTVRDLKTKVEKFTEDDKKNCQSIIKRSYDEFVPVGPPKKRRKKSDSDKKVAAAVSPADKKEEVSEKVKKTPKKAPTAKKETPKKSSTAKKETPKKPSAAKNDTEKKTKSPAKKTPVATKKAKTAPKKKGDDGPDSDDEKPISKMTAEKKAKAKTSETPAKRKATEEKGATKKTSASKTPKVRKTKATSAESASKSSSSKKKTPKKKA